MQQMYEMWLTLTGQNCQADGPMVTQPVPEEKYIAMPTDYAEPLVGFYYKKISPLAKSKSSWLCLCNVKRTMMFPLCILRAASTAACVVNTVTVSVSGSSTSPLRSTRTECSAVREKTRLWRGATVFQEHALNCAPSKNFSWISLWIHKLSCCWTELVWDPASERCLSQFQDEVGGHPDHEN